MPNLEITSRQNPRVKQTARLHERKGRVTSGRFIVEGRLEITRALEAQLPCLEAWQCPDFPGYDEALALQLTVNATDAITVPKPVMEKLSRRENPDGQLAVFEQLQTDTTSLKLSEKPLVVVVDGVEKPGNLGAIIRSAEVAGADALIVSGESTDLYNPHVIRNSRGLVFKLPVVAMEAEAAYGFLKGKGLQLLATTPAATLPHWQAGLTAPCALLLGSEAEGLGDFWLERADACIQIPLHGSGDSLNVSVSAAVVLFEALRQRQAGRDA